MTRRVMFYVQHLLGIGHVKRAASLAKGMAESGLDVTVVLGGMAVADVDFGFAKCVFLPSARALDQTFSTIVDVNGQPINPTWKTARCHQLLAIYDDIKPDVLMVELFPFGRRAFRFELLPLLDRARNDCFITCSVRDVLVQKNDDVKTRQAIDWVKHYFNLVLVHGDPRFIGFAETFPAASEIEHLIRYTGYVVDRPNMSDGSLAGLDEIIISTGGGAVGAELIETALLAQPISPHKNRKWRILAGHNLSENQFQRFKNQAPSGVIVERARPDFHTLLNNAAVSVSQGGYNTVMDILVSQCRAVIVPFAEAQESEQTYRARKFADLGRLVMIGQANLTAETLNLAIEQAIKSVSCPLEGPDLNGVDKTIEILLDPHAMTG